MQLLDFIISELPEKIKPFLENISNNRNVITKQMCEKILSDLNIDIDNLMIMLLPFAAEFAKVEISNFKVGAAVLGTSGNIYFGSNMEFAGESLNNSVHAEQSAVNNAWLNGEKGISKIAVTAAPCGHCRQFLNEIAKPENLKIILKNNESNMIEIFELNQFLPISFGPKDLNVPDSLMNKTNHKLSIINETDELILSALDAANQSYSPYTKNYSGVSIRTEDGNIYSGRYAENAAFNPSLLPFQSALANLNMNCKLGTKHSIVDAVLVESESKISNKYLTEGILSKMGNIKLRYYIADN